MALLRQANDRAVHYAADDLLTRPALGALAIVENPDAVLAEDVSKQTLEWPLASRVGDRHRTAGLPVLTAMLAPPHDDNQRPMASVRCSSVQPL